MKVKDLMRLNPKTVHLETPLEVVWNIVGEQRFHMVPVIDKEGSIKGIITAEDILVSLVPDYREFFSEFFPDSPTIEDIEGKIEKNLQLAAADVMNKTVYTAHREHDVFKALSRMLAYNLRVLPVIDEYEKLVGFIVEKDIFKYLFKKQKHILKKIKRKKKQEEKGASKISLLAKSLKEKQAKYLNTISKAVGLKKEK